MRIKQYNKCFWFCFFLGLRNVSSFFLVKDVDYASQKTSCNVCTMHAFQGSKKSLLS